MKTIEYKGMTAHVHDGVGITDDKIYIEFKYKCKRRRVPHSELSELALKHPVVFDIMLTQASIQLAHVLYLILIEELDDEQLRALLPNYPRPVS